jgi:hypothetical protein
MEKRKHGNLRGVEMSGLERWLLRLGSRTLLLFVILSVLPTGGLCSTEQKPKEIRKDWWQQAETLLGGIRQAVLSETYHLKEPLAANEEYAAGAMDFSGGPIDFDCKAYGDSCGCVVKGVLFPNVVEWRGLYRLDEILGIPSPRVIPAGTLVTVQAVDFQRRRWRKNSIPLWMVLDLTVGDEVVNVYMKITGITSAEGQEGFKILWGHIFEEPCPLD